MTKCFSLTASRTFCLRSTFSTSGLRSTTTDLGDGTVIHCWIPKHRHPTRPDLLLLHGFGANAMWQWGPDFIPRFARYFNVYVPDLVFFGDSFTTRPDRSESFQAECVYRVMEVNSVRRVRVVGLSYGGFVAYSMAAQYKEWVERVVICCAGVCLEERDVAEGMFPAGSLEEAAEMLLPQTPEKMKELMKVTFVKPPVKMPKCILVDFIDEMNKEHLQEKKELVLALGKGRKLSELPKIPQPTLIIWGDKDQVFPLELGYRLKRHLGDNAELVVLKDTGHAYIVEKTKEFYKHLKSFLLPEVPPIPSSMTTSTAASSTTTTVTNNYHDPTTTTTTTATNNHHHPITTTATNKHHDPTTITATNNHHGPITTTATNHHHDPTTITATNNHHDHTTITSKNHHHDPTTLTATNNHHDPTTIISTNNHQDPTTITATNHQDPTTITTTNHHDPTTITSTNNHHDPHHLHSNGSVTVTT